MIYRCPDPTPEQIALGELLGYDPYDRCGDGPLDSGACDVLGAACVIHDELFILGGTIDDFHAANERFTRDCIILSHAEDDAIEIIFNLTRAVEFTLIVTTTAFQFWHFKDRNTDITRAQGAQIMLEAKRWINTQAAKISVEVPYPEAL